MRHIYLVYRLPNLDRQDVAERLGESLRRHILRLRGILTAIVGYW